MKTQNTYLHIQRKTEIIYQQEERLRFLLCILLAFSWALVELFRFSTAVFIFVPSMGGEGITIWIASKLFLFFPFWEDFLHKWSLSKLISRGSFYFKKKKVYRFFSADLMTETHPVPSRIVSSVRFSMWLLFQMEPVLPQARQGLF